MILPISCNINIMENDSGEVLKAEHGQHPNSVAALERHRESTQFGAERANPQYQELDLPHPRSIRNSVRHLIGQPDDDETECIGILILRKGATKAQKYAAAIINAGAKADKANCVPDFMRVAEFLTDQVDGKLAQVNLNADAAAIEGMSDAEIDRELAAVRAAQERIDAGKSETNEEEKGPDAGPEIGRGIASGDAASM